MADQNSITETRTVMLDTVGDLRRHLSSNGWKSTVVVSLDSAGGVVGTMPTTMTALRQMLVGRKGDAAFTAHVNMDWHHDGSKWREFVVSGYQDS